MPNCCVAYGCTNFSGSAKSVEKGISFHKFPFNDKFRLKLWLMNIRRKNFKPHLNARICSEHFLEEDFEYQPFTNRRGLKKTAVPTKFCFSRTVTLDEPRTVYKLIEKVVLQDRSQTIDIEDKSTQTVDSFTSSLLAEIQKLKAENTELRNALTKFDLLLDVLT